MDMKEVCSELLNSKPDSDAFFMAIMRLHYAVLVGTNTFTGNICTISDSDVKARRSALAQFAKNSGVTSLAPIFQSLVEKGTVSDKVLPLCHVLLRVVKNCEDSFVHSLTYRSKVSQAIHGDNRIAPSVKFSCYFGSARRISEY